MLLFFNQRCLIFLVLMGSLAQAGAGKLAIVIDDVGFRSVDESNVLQMPTPISIAILPYAPYAKEMAARAHSQGREILIHLPMAPLNPRLLERDMLQPTMTVQEIQPIIRQAMEAIPEAVGMNNHMGSAMTSSFAGMRNVFSVLRQYPLRYFLDSRTVADSQVLRAAEGSGLNVLERNVFLDDSNKEADIREQFNRAVQLAQRKGVAIAIGHPRATTVKVLQHMLPRLPKDIVLVTPSSLLSLNASPQPGGIPQCIRNGPLPTVSPLRFFKLVEDGVKNSRVIKLLQARWHYWWGSDELSPEK